MAEAKKELLVPTQKDLEVIRLMRQTDYGKVLVTVKTVSRCMRRFRKAYPLNKQSCVTNYETLTVAEAAYQVIVDNEASRTALPTPVISSGAAGLYAATPVAIFIDVDYTMWY